ncbi:MAG TPA: response regulator [Polyangiales bacterium]|jgi:DNA-binding response OmpR family regulator|nr:response regulator [Polyangiales bacterium]
MVSKSRTKPTVLIADDDLEILTMVRTLLRRRDIKLLEASDGDEAMRLIRENQPDLVVLDVMMPGQSGWEICKAIREDEVLKKTGVVMLTGIGERLNEMTSPLYGADAYLDKPFELTALDNAVSKVLADRGH